MAVALHDDDGADVHVVVLCCCCRCYVAAVMVVLVVVILGFNDDVDGAEGNIPGGERRERGASKGKGRRYGK